MSIAYLHIHVCNSYYNCYYLNNYISYEQLYIFKIENYIENYIELKTILKLYSIENYIEQLYIFKI